MSTSLHQKIHSVTDKHEHARYFLFLRGILKSFMFCPGCPMMLIAWSYGAALLSESSKTFGLTVSSLARSFPYRVQTFPILTFYLSIKSLASIAVAQLSDLSEISEWKTLLHVRVSNWLMSNPSTLGAPGVIVKVDEAKFGKRK